MVEKTKLYVLCGFSGAGKSSFLKNISAYLAEEKIGIIVNEFGVIQGEGKVFRKNGVNFTLRRNGSISCSCKASSITDALVEMADHSLGYVFVEKEGVADTANLCRVLDAVQAKKGEVYEYKGMICIVDGLYFLDQMENSDAVRRQLEQCQLAVINKADLVGKKTMEKIREKIAGVNRSIEVEEAKFGRFDYSFLGEDLLGIHAKACEDAPEALDSKPEHLILKFEGEMRRAELNRFLEEASKICIRIKGYFELEDGWNLVDVAGRNIEYKISGASERGSILVLVCKSGQSAAKSVKGCWDRTIGKKMSLS
jgi:G3E family GTPase